MDKVLVVYGTASGTTGVVGLTIGEQLSRAGFQVDVRPCSRAQEPSPYCAVILGSALDEGGWEPCALDYATRHAVTLAEQPTWLYQVTETVQPVSFDDAATTVLSSVRADGPVTFSTHSLEPDVRPVQSRAVLDETSCELGEWGPARLWGLLLANELAPSTRA